jgi:DNA-binding NtrC family response regulator
MDVKKHYILIVDDDKNFVSKAECILQGLGDCIIDKGYCEEDFYSKFIPGKYDAVILDLRLKENYEGMQLLEYALNEDPEAPIIVLTGYSSVETAVSSLKMGAKDYLEKEHFEAKPFLSMVERTIIESKARKLADQMIPDSIDHHIIGSDLKIQRILKLATIFADLKESPILIIGEEGTEKEEIAKYIYKKSGARGKFVRKIIEPGEKNIEEELFGMEGSPGLIMEARGGILYLEEIGLLDKKIQKRLLDFINTGQLVPKKQKTGQNIKTQLVLSSSRPLELILSQGALVSEFYYRLRTIEILIPPLRERRSDIHFIASHYLESLKQRGKARTSEISPEVLNLLDLYPWPGNTRELRHILELSSLNAQLKTSTAIKLEHLPFDLQENGGHVNGAKQLDLDKILAETTLKYMRIALKKTGGAKLEAYQYLGYPESKRGTMNARIKKIFEQYPDITSKFQDIYNIYIGGKIETK